MMQSGSRCEQASRTPSSKKTLGRQSDQSTTQWLVQRMLSYSACPTRRGERRSSIRIGCMPPVCIPTTASRSSSKKAVYDALNGHSINSCTASSLAQSSDCGVRTAW